MKNILWKSELNRMTEGIQKNAKECQECKRMQKNAKECEIVLRNENEYERMKNTINE